MAILLDHGAQAVVAGDIGLGFMLQDQGLWRIEWWAIDGLSTGQPVEQVRATCVFVGTPASRAISTAAKTACPS